MRDTSASAGSAGAGNRDNTPDAHHCPYSDIRLSNRASHGDADAAVGAWMRPGWSEPFHPQVGVPGGFAIPPGATSAAAAIFGEWPGGSAAGPAPAASSDQCQCAECTAEAAHRAESEAGMHTWLANNLPPAPPQQTSGVETGKGGGQTWRPSVPKSSSPRPSTATDAWQGSSRPASSSAWEQTPTPWSASSSRSWQGWSSWEWRDDATSRHERGTAPYSKGKGKKGKKGHDPAS